MGNNSSIFIAGFFGAPGFFLEFFLAFFACRFWLAEGMYTILSGNGLWNALSLSGGNFGVFARQR